MSKERESVGILVKNLTPLHGLEYRIVFNLHENTFFQQLISKEILETIRVRPIEYFKSLLFLEYFSNILENDYGVCKNLENLSKAIRSGEINKLEKLEIGASYLNLETVLIEAGLWAKERQLNIKKTSEEKANEVQERYKQDEVVDFDAEDIRKLDPFYEGMGEVVCSQVSDRMRPYLEHARSRADIGALVFVDSVLTFLGDNKINSQAYQFLDNKDYSAASLVVFEHLKKQASISKLKSIIESQDD